MVAIFFMAHQYYRTKGIVLKKENRNEADQVFTIFTEKYGKIEVVGKAIRKITSKLRASIDIFYLTKIEFIQGKNQKILTDAILIDKFNSQKQNPEACGVAFQIAEMVDSLIIREQADRDIWYLLVEFFFYFESLKLKIIPLLFFWKLVDLLGYKPELFYCPLCKKKLLAEKLFFAFDPGGVICRGCLDKNSEPLIIQEIDSATIKALRLFIADPIEKIERLAFKEREIENIQRLSASCLAFLKEGVGSRRG